MLNKTFSTAAQSANEKTAKNILQNNILLSHFVFWSILALMGPFSAAAQENKMKKC